MFSFLKKKQVEVFSPVNGEIIELQEVNDPVFSQKMMGEGFAIIPSDTSIFSPISGSIISIFPTKHALSIRSNNGIDVLLHIGIDTVSLEGKGLYPKVYEGQNVNVGDELIVVDLNYIAEQGKENTVMVVFPDLKDKLCSVHVGKKHMGEVAATIQ